MVDVEKEEFLKRINQLEKEQAKHKRNKRILLIIVLIIALAVAGFFVYLYFNVWNNTGYLRSEEEEIICISKEELEQYITTVDITLDNWQEYVILEDVEYEDTNAFGEVTNTRKYTEFKLADNVAGSIALEANINENLISGSDNSRQISVSYLGNTSLSPLKDKNDDENVDDSTITANDFTVTRAEGTIYILDIDSLPLQYDEETGEEVIRIGTSDSYTSWSKDDFDFAQYYYFAFLQE